MHDELQAKYHAAHEVFLAAWNNYMAHLLADYGEVSDYAWAEQTHRNPETEAAKWAYKDACIDVHNANFNLQEARFKEMRK